VILGEDGAVWHVSYNGTWSEWASLGGNFESAPSISSLGANQLLIFVRGADHDLYSKQFDGVSWSNEWLDQSRYIGKPASTILTGDPACFALGQRLDCFVLGQDHNVWHDTYDTTLYWGIHWSGWSLLPQQSGSFVGGPSAYGWKNPQYLGVVALASNGSVLEDNWNGWSSNWTQLPVAILTQGSDPACVSPQVGYAACVGLGVDGKIWLTKFVSGAWQDWTALPGGEALSSGPTITTWGPNRLDVFARGSDNGLWVNTFDNGTWSGWSAVPMTTTANGTSPAA